MGLVTGAEAMVAGTLETLHAFPDRRLLGEDVIWSGDEETGFLSSHRIVSPMRHLGDGPYGPATGRRVRMRAIADCAVKDNQVYEEWLVRDQAAIVRAIGAEPRGFAAAQVARELQAGRTPTVFTPDDDVPGTYRAPEPSIEEALVYGELLEALWVDRNLARVREIHDEAVSLELPCGEVASGHAAADRFWLGYLAALPDARFDLEHLIGRADPGRSVRVAARWSLNGAHDGHGAFGAPSGADLYIMGISHAEMVDGRIIREWIVVDELAVWRQIAIAAG